MKDSIIRLCPETAKVFTVSDIRNMYRALDEMPLSKELYVTLPMAKRLCERAIAAEALKNRYIEVWNIAFKKL